MSARVASSDAFAARYRGGEPVAAPHPQSAVLTPDSAPDPIVLAQAYEAARRKAAESAAYTPPPPTYSAAVQARGGDRSYTAQDLPQAISLNQATFHGSRIIGPAIAAWFVARWGNAAAFYANGASFLAVIVSLMLIRPRPPATGGGTVNMVHFMAEGVTYVRERPKIVALLGLTAITTLFVFPNMAILMPYYAQHVLNVVRPLGDFIESRAPHRVERDRNSPVAQCLEQL